LGGNSHADSPEESNEAADSSGDGTGEAKSVGLIRMRVGLANPIGLSIPNGDETAEVNGEDIREVNGCRNVKVNVGGTETTMVVAGINQRRW
jgi:hypothetical protein